jgi:membrane-associated protease RseP (regulator of RpoE activity)
MNTEQRRILLQIGLFIVTFFTTTIAGADFCFGKSIYAYTPEGGLIGFNKAFTWDDFMMGARFSVPFLLILTVHEFGHYFTAMYHKVRASLPYYIPFPPIPHFLQLIGTFGAIIRLRSKVRSNIHHFDIGLAGPLAGFVVALAVLYYGFTNLPPQEYVYQFHPEYEQFGADYPDHVYTKEFLQSQGVSTYLDIQIGSNLLFEFFKKFVADPERAPDPHELMHYPVLLAGFIALFFTALNLLPIGQLDGGHIIYGMFGKKGHNLIATSFYILLVFYSGLGIAHAVRDQYYYHPPYIHAFMVYVPISIFFNYFCFQGLKLGSRDTLMISLLVFAVQFVSTSLFPDVDGYRGWVLFGVLLGRFVGIHHPPAELESPLDGKRIAIGWLMIVIFIVTFSPKPLILEVVSISGQ